MASDIPQDDNVFDSARKAFNDTAANFAGQAGAKARDYADQGKDRAVEALGNVANLVGDAADQVTERLGDQYGGYVRQAADAVEGMASNLRGKDTDELFDDARDMVRNSPVIALAAAAAIGFVVARVVKSGMTPRADDGSDAIAKPAPRKAAAKPRAKARPAAAKPAAKTTPAA